MKLPTIGELKRPPFQAWSLIPPSTVDKLCQGFSRRLELCLANGEESISNELFRIAERPAAKSFPEANRVHEPWTEAEDDQLLRDYLVIGPRRKTLGKRWKKPSASQLKKWWYQVIRRRVHTQLDDTMGLATTLEQPRKGLPVPPPKRGQGKIERKRVCDSKVGKNIPSRKNSILRTRGATFKRRVSEKVVSAAT
jgi:hypothetical protein